MRNTSRRLLNSFHLSKNRRLNTRLCAVLDLDVRRTARWKCWRLWKKSLEWILMKHLLMEKFDSERKTVSRNVRMVPILWLMANSITTWMRIKQKKFWKKSNKILVTNKPWIEHWLIFFVKINEYLYKNKHKWYYKCNIFSTKNVTRMRWWK